MATSLTILKNKKNPKKGFREEWEIASSVPGNLTPPPENLLILRRTTWPIRCLGYSHQNFHPELIEGLKTLVEGPPKWDEEP